MTGLAALWAAVVLLGAWRRRPPPARLRRAVTAAPPRDRPAHTPIGQGGQRPPRPSRRPKSPALVAVIVALVGAVVFAVAWPPAALLFAAGWFVRRRWLPARARRRRQDAIAAAVPDVVDLLVVAIGAGLTPALAIRRLAGVAPEPFGGAFSEVDRRAQRGTRLADALDALVELVGDPARPIATTIGSAERYGAPLGPALDLLAHDSRQARRRRADELARTLPVKLSFPLVCCILPAFVLLTIAPLVAGAVRSLQI